MTTEHEHQVSLFQWAALSSGKYPELKLMFAIPNGGHRHKLTAVKLKAEGVKAGVPDIFLPVAKGGYHGLFIELKNAKGKLQPSQDYWLKSLSTKGYKAVVCYGWEAAKNTIEDYLNG